VNSRDVPNGSERSAGAPSSPRRHEPFSRTFARNVAIAVGIGIVAALVRRAPAFGARIGVLALWFSLGGHYVEVLFLNEVRPRIPSGLPPQRLARVVFWFVGGALLYSCMAATARLLAMRALHFDAWWLGALGFIAVELVVHAVLALRRVPNFYRGDA
jgi:hypothetical protein